MRIEIDKLACAIEGLAEHGPLKPEALRGLTCAETLEPAIELLPPDQKKWAYVTAQGNQRINTDKTGYRIGVAPSKDLSDRMIQIAAEAKNYISKNRTLSRLNTTEEELHQHLDNLRGMVMIAYPGYHGLPEWDMVYMILERKMDFLGFWPDCDVINYFLTHSKWIENGEQIAWFSNKELDPKKRLCDNMAGKPNDKTTLIIKLTPKGSGAPVKEAPIDQNTQKEMMAYYYKKQEEQKKLEADDDDNHYDSPWANPNALKYQLHGTGDIKWRK